MECPKCKKQGKIVKSIYGELVVCKNCSYTEVKVEAMKIETTETWEKEFDNLYKNNKNIQPNLLADDIKAFIHNLLYNSRKELVVGICRLLDNIELEDVNKSMQQWKQYKNIRNAIWDKNVLKENQ